MLQEIKVVTKSNLAVNNQKKVFKEIGNNANIGIRGFTTWKWKFQ